MAHPTEMFRDFKGIWIPKEIWLDSSLDFFEKSLFAEIHSLDGKNGCYADNPYFCKFFNISERTLQRGLKKLKEYKYISVQSYNGRQRVLRSNMKSVYDKFDTSDPSPKNDNDKFDTPDPTNLSSSSIGGSIEGYNKIHNINKKKIIKEKNSPSAQTTPRQASRTATSSKITFSKEKRFFEGIEKEDIAAWKAKFPAVNVEHQIDLCVEWAVSNDRKNYRNSIFTWLNNVQKSNTEPFKGAQEGKKDVSAEEVRLNKNKALKWEKLATDKAMGGGYAIQATPDKIVFAIPYNQGYEVSYETNSQEFEKKCLTALKRMRILNE